MKIIKGKQVKAQKIVIYGPEGVGKSTLASKCPEPLFIDTEGSTSQLDVARVGESIATSSELRAVLSDILGDPAVCKTLVIDTADWMEKMLSDDLCKRNKWNGIEGAGYGKGYIYLAEEVATILRMLDAIVDTGINVVFTAHAQMRKQELPNEEGAFDRWELKLTKKSAPLLKEWADALLFCNYETILTGSGEKKKAKGNQRVIYTEHHACWDAKNRHGLDYKLPLSYDSIACLFPEVEKSNSVEAIINEVAETVPAPKPKKTDKQKNDAAKELLEMAKQSGAEARYNGIDIDVVKLIEKHNTTPEMVEGFLIEKGYIEKGKHLKDLNAEENQWLISVFDKIAEKISLPFEF